VIKDNGLPFPPIFKIEVRAVFGLMVLIAVVWVGVVVLLTGFY
jgi:hypothetical protein